MQRSSVSKKSRIKLLFGINEVQKLKGAEKAENTQKTFVMKLISPATVNLKIE